MDLQLKREVEEQLLHKYKSISEEVRLALLEQFIGDYHEWTETEKQMKAILEEPNPGHS